MIGGTVSDICTKVFKAGISNPAIIMVGEVAGLLAPGKTIPSGKLRSSPTYAG